MKLLDLETMELVPQRAIEYLVAVEFDVNTNSLYNILTGLNLETSLPMAVSTSSTVMWGMRQTTSTQ
jgi:hypothetical protein